MVNFDRVRESLALFSAHDVSRCTQPQGNLNFKHRHDSSREVRSLTVSSVFVWYFISAVLAVGLGVLVIWKRRQERAVSDYSEQIRRLTFEAGTAGRIGLEGKPQSLEKLGSAVNKLLENLEQRGATLQGREQLFQRLVETVHDAVLVHRKQILFANSRFLTLLGLNATEVVGRPLSDFVGPEYVELVDNNLRRR